VCGCELRRADAAGAVDFHGVVYFFCSVACHDAFLAEPERYARSEMPAANPNP